MNTKIKFINCSFILLFICSFSILFDVITPLRSKTKRSLSSLIQLQQNKTQSTNQNIKKKEIKNNEIAKDNQKNLNSLAAQEKKMKELFMKTIKQVKNLIGNIKKQDKIQKSINSTVIKSLNHTKGIKSKLTVLQYRTEIKLNKMNKNLISSLEGQIKSTLTILKDEVIKQLKKINLLTIKIKQLRMKLEKSDTLCQKYFNCGSCLKNKKCGWCGMTQTCMEGDENGPKKGSCMFFDKKVCSGKKDCEIYKDCKGCIKDTSCGWCNKPGNPICINEQDVNHKSCRDDFFVHQHRSLNICPHIIIKTYKYKILKKLENDETDLKIANITANITIDPKERKRIQEDLNVFEEKIEDEKNIFEKYKENYQTVLNSLEELEKDEYIFKHYYDDKNFNNKIINETIFEMYQVMKEFIYDYRIHLIKEEKKKKKKTNFIIIYDNPRNYINNILGKSITEGKNNNIRKTLNSNLTNSNNLIKNLKEKQIKKEIPMNKNNLKKIKEEKKILNNSTKLENTKNISKNIVKKEKNHKANNKFSKKISKNSNKIKNSSNVRPKKNEKEIDNLIMEYKSKIKVKKALNDTICSLKKKIKKNLININKSKKKDLKNIISIEEESFKNYNKNLKKSLSVTIKFKKCNNSELFKNSINSKPKSNQTYIKNKKISMTNFTDKDDNSSLSIENNLEDFQNENGYNSLKSWENRKDLMQGVIHLIQTNSREIN